MIEVNDSYGRTVFLAPSAIAPDYPETAIALQHLDILEVQYGRNGPSIQLRAAILKMNAAWNGANAASFLAGRPGIDAMVSRFLGWEFPKDFAPDGAIRFNRVYADVAYWDKFIERRSGKKDACAFTRRRLCRLTSN